MRRREFITLLSCTTVIRPIAAWAQQREQIARIGVLMGTAVEDPEGQARMGKADSAQIMHLITSGSSAKKFINDFKSRGTAVLTY